jgi:hypothetical protein
MIDDVKRNFLEGVRAKAKKKRQEAAAKRKRSPIAKAKTPVDPRGQPDSTPSLLAEIRDLLRSHLKNGELPTGSSVEFAVTERDQNGKIKSFKVTS